MEFEFDKEMDVLLRQAARGEIAPENPKSKIQNPKSLHLDADEISAFAESSLPEKTRLRLTRHFADCDRCRKILSDLISQNSANEAVSAKQIEVVAPIVPWYRKLFVFPNVAYTMGALVLVFSGLAAFTIFQNVENSRNTEISQVSERPQSGAGMSSDGETVTVEKQSVEPSASSAMSNASMSNAASVSSSNSMMSNASTNAGRSFNANSSFAAPTVSNKQGVSANESPKDKTRPEDETAKQAVADLPPPAVTQNNLTQQKPENAKRQDKRDAEIAEADKSAPPPKPEQPSVSENSENKTLSDAPGARARKRSQASGEGVNVAGKTFKRADNAWVDSAYKGQVTTNVTRGTREYKKLDSGLRGVAENLGGTVIILWQDKAYRIQ